MENLGPQIWLEEMRRKFPSLDPYDIAHPNGREMQRERRKWGENERGMR